MFAVITPDGISHGPFAYVTAAMVWAERRGFTHYRIARAHA